MLIRSIGSICTATVRGMCFRLSNTNETLILYVQSWARTAIAAESQGEAAEFFDHDQALFHIRAACHDHAGAGASLINARRHAELTDDFGAAFAGAMNVERVNAL